MPTCLAGNLPARHRHIPDRGLQTGQKQCMCRPEMAIGQTGLFSKAFP